MFSNFESSFALLSVRLVLVPKQIVTIKPEKGRRACNYISKIWITCIKKVDAKCWLEEMTLALVMTSLPLAHAYMCFSMFVYSHTCFCFVLIGRNLTAQSTGSHRGTRQNSKSRDVSFLFLPHCQSIPESLPAGYINMDYWIHFVKETKYLV